MSSTLKRRHFNCCVRERDCGALSLLVESNTVYFLLFFSSCKYPRTGWLLFYLSSRWYLFCSPLFFSDRPLHTVCLFKLFRLRTPAAFHNLLLNETEQQHSGPCSLTEAIRHNCQCFFFFSLPASEGFFVLFVCISAHVETLPNNRMREHCLPLWPASPSWLSST